MELIPQNRNGANVKTPTDNFVNDLEGLRNYMKGIVKNVIDMMPYESNIIVDNYIKRCYNWAVEDYLKEYDVTHHFFEIQKDHYLKKCRFLFKLIIYNQSFAFVHEEFI